MTLASLVCGLQCAARGPAFESKGQGKLGIAQFDEWMKDEDTLMPSPRRYEVRRGRGNSGDELLVTVVAYGEYPPRDEWQETNTSPEFFSISRYAVSLDGQFKTRPASAGEWEKGARLLHSKHEILGNIYLPPGSPKTQTDKAVLYQGKSYAKSGESWGNPVALVSPRGKWLAVFSYTATGIKPPAIIPPLAAPEAGNGDLFVDVYDLSDGQKVMGGRAPYSNNGPSLLFGGALWIEDQYLLMPLDASSETCLLAITPH